MHADTDALRHEMRVERIEREDGRTLLLFSWPTPTKDVAAGARAEEPSMEPWSPDAGPADV